MGGGGVNEAFTLASDCCALLLSEKQPAEEIGQNGNWNHLQDLEGKNLSMDSRINICLKLPCSQCISVDSKGYGVSVILEILDRLNLSLL